MERRIIYKNETGGVSVIIPFLGCGMIIEQIAAKDVPTDRSQRGLWGVGEADLTDGVGA